MEIKPGYKRTEIGVIPEDWEVLQLGTLTRSVASGKSKNKKATGAFAFYGSTGIIGHSNDFDYVGARILVARVGANAGSLYRVDGRYSVSDNTLIVDVLYPEDLIYLSYYLEYINLNRIVFGSGQPLVTGSQIKKILIPKPQKLETKMITEALSDIKHLIRSLEKLIEKKKLIMQGVMQELLTGKKRLSGFTGEWKTNTLGEIGEITGAGVDKKTNPNDEPIRLVNYLDVFHMDFIYSRDLAHYVTATFKQISRCQVQKGDVFFTPSSETREDIALSALANEDIPDACYSYHVVRLRFTEKWNHKYKAYAFQTRVFLEQAETLCEGSGKRYVLTLPKLRALRVRYPVDLTEQKAIGELLYEMDEEIRVYDVMQRKYQNLKQAMMQELLTGRIRLL